MDTASSTAIYADAIAGARASGTSDDPIVISVHVLHLPSYLSEVFRCTSSLHAGGRYHARLVNLLDASDAPQLIAEYGPASPQSLVQKITAAATARRISPPCQTSYPQDPFIISPSDPAGL